MLELIQGETGVHLLSAELLQAARQACDGMGGLRGRGLIVAADISGDAFQVAQRALLEQRLVINATGPKTLRFLPPLIVEESSVDEAVHRVSQVL